MAGVDEVRFRLIRADDAPASNPEGDAFLFGLQDAKQNLTPGERNAEGVLQWDFSLRVKQGPDPDLPVFLGPFASGPADDRFVYLSWVSIPRRVYINRLKCRLNTVTWSIVHAAQTTGRPIVGDVSGRGPRQAMQPVGWRVE